MNARAHRSSATLLAAVCGLLIVYATLYPFEGWRDQGVEPWAFLQGPWPRYWSRFDVVANGLGYIPLGFLLTLALLRTRLLPQPALIATLLASALSLLLEMLQTYLPLRVPQLSDWLLNSGGAWLGALLAPLTLGAAFAHAGSCATRARRWCCWCFGLLPCSSHRLRRCRWVKYVKDCMRQ